MDVSAREGVGEQGDIRSRVKSGFAVLEKNPGMDVVRVETDKTRRAFLDLGQKKKSLLQRRW